MHLHNNDVMWDDVRVQGCPTNHHQAKVMAPTRGNRDQTMHVIRNLRYLLGPIFILEVQPLAQQEDG